MTLAEAMIATLKSHGVKFLFGVPGGGSSLDLIAAADRAGLHFILCRGETSAAIAAAVVGELTGAPGVVLTAIGPGAASAVNGVAYAHLERAPLILIADAREEGEAIPPHQVFDLQALFKPIAKACRRVTPENGVAQFADLVSLVQRKPHGPVLVELSGSDAGQAVMPISNMAQQKVAADSQAVGTSDDPAAQEAANALLADSRYPVLLIGLQAASPDSGAELRRLAERLGCPLLTTYKAKGVVADGHAQMLGHFTGADGEGEALQRADLIIWAGVDPVELIPVAWRYAAPLLVLSDVAGLEYPVPPAVVLSGPLPQTVDLLAAASAPSVWSGDEIAALRGNLRQRARLKGGNGHTAEDVVDAVITATAATAAAGEDICFTVDAGAHMISAMAKIEARQAKSVLKSTGLSTMGFALPAAIAAALVTPERRVVAFTGDGGLMMCLAELSTAARLGCRLTVVVLNDAALSLIDVKQQRRQQQPVGVRYPAIDFAAAASGLGCRAWTVERDGPLLATIDAALAHEGAGLIDIRVDPAGYGDQLAALRG
ncbi:MAG: thiamine pyrophosphate-binding protein [Rhodospirillaceae bacterium]|nr:thiamine pyrophosphate-binding protein [Rhodospirillaceae bacterium]MBT5779395.1 thiamine pyrophosphate-binding protein [Rhodospirillaceae bacterium]